MYITNKKNPINKEKSNSSAITDNVDLFLKKNH